MTDSPRRRLSPSLAHFRGFHLQMATAKSASARAPLARLPAATGHSARPHLLLTPWSPTAHPPRPNKRTTRHPGEVAEERLLAYWPQRGSGPAGDEVVSQFDEHRYYLSPLLPPASFMADPTSVPERGLLRIKGVRSVLHMAGRLLGGADELTERRWEHLADGVLLKELCSHLVHEQIKPLGPYGKGEELALTRLCIPGGCVHAFPLSSTCLPSYSIHPSLRPSIHPSPTPPRAAPAALFSPLSPHMHAEPEPTHTPRWRRSKSWLAPGTRRWAALRALAEHHARQPDESGRACLRRCWRGCARRRPPVSPSPKPATLQPPRLFPASALPLPRLRPASSPALPRLFRGRPSFASPHLHSPPPAVLHALAPPAVAAMRGR